MKRTLTPDLIGRTVLVNPDIAGDTALRKREPGKVVSWFPEREILTVRFKDRQQVTYVSGDLIILQPKKIIRRALISGLIQNAHDCKTVLNVYRCVLLKKYGKALRLATENEAALFFCTQKCRDRIILWKSKFKTT